MSELKIIATGLKFPEGPVALPDGSVAFTEIAGGQVRRVAPDGTLSVVGETGGGPNGLAIGPDGAYYVCNNGGSEYKQGGHFTWTNIGVAKDYNGGSIQRIDARTGKVTPLYTHCGPDKLSAPNDIVFDKQQGFYFTDIGKRHKRYRDQGGIYYARPDGSNIRVVAYPVGTPNGIALSPDGKVLYYAETDTSRLWAYDILEPGVVKKLDYPSPNGGRLVCGLPGYQRFDSIAVEANGNICVATFITGFITVISQDGKVVREVKVPDTFPTNICFGGMDMRTAYITLSGVGQLVSMPWPEAGLRLNF
jgi:gluconolactonase